MSKFLAYEATGYILERDKEGRVLEKQKKRPIKARGNVLNADDKYGAIMRQNPDLLRCDRVIFDTWGI